MDGSGCSKDLMDEEIVTPQVDLMPCYRCHTKFQPIELNIKNITDEYTTKYCEKCRLIRRRTSLNLKY